MHTIISHKTGRMYLLGAVACIFLSSFNATAQHYIGGSVYANGSLRTGTEQEQSFSTRVSPDIGWILGNDWRAGLRPTVYLSIYQSDDSDDDRQYSGLQISSDLGITPYARYQLFTWHQFGFWVESMGTLKFSPNWSRLEYRYKDESRDDHVSENSNHSFQFEISVLPVLTFQLTKHLSMEAHLQLFSASLTGKVGNKTPFQLDYALDIRKNLVSNVGYLDIGFLYFF